MTEARGKSVIALQLAAAVSLGHSWLAMPVREGRAVLISAEDDLDQLHRRLSAITRGQGVELSNLDRLTIRSLAGEDALLARLDAHGGTLAPTDLLAEVDHVLRENAPGGNRPSISIGAAAQVKIGNDTSA